MTTDLLSLLKNMLSVPGLSGHEVPIRKVIQEAWTPLADEFSVSQMGSLHALRHGTARLPRPSVLLSAHMDAIGMIVSEIRDGFMSFTQIGGVDPRILPGQMVTVHGRKDLPGMVVMPPIRLLPPSYAQKTVPMEYLLIDTGLLPKDVEKLVRIGDLVSFAQPPMETASETVVGHTLDNRASVAVLTHFLDLLQARPHAWDVWAVASVQEEVTMAGAMTSAFQLRPSLALIVDVTFGASPGSPVQETFPLGGGPTLGWGPNVHPYLFKSFKELADRLEIPYGMDVMPAHSGTDAYGIQVSEAGIPCMVLSIPLRYMHTPVEMVMLKDITRAGRLLAEFVASLPADYMDKLTWED